MTSNIARRAIIALAVALALPLASCSQSGTGAAEGRAAGERSQADLEQIALTITQADAVHTFTVEVARTAEQQAQGLMGRTELAADRGMLFPFPQPKFATFWMRNTLIPLDMIFIRADGTIDRIAENTLPQDESPVASGGEVQAVLELAGGTTTRLGIDETATVRWATAVPPR
jgi:uncharacterized protein